MKFLLINFQVYCRFKAVDHETGRMSYLINRKTWLKITDLVMRGLRIADPHVAALQGRIVTGRNVGRTEVQVTVEINDWKWSTFLSQEPVCSSKSIFTKL